MRSRAERRKNDYKKAIRKRKIVKEVYAHRGEWYEYLHQYSKNKVHCSCPMCREKTRDKVGLWYGKYNPPIRDKRKMIKLKQEKDEYNTK